MSRLLIGLVGDLLVNRAAPSEVFSEVRDILAVPSVLFGNLEGVYTNDPRPIANAVQVVSPPAHNLDVYAEVGFNVMSLANNHIMDAGGDAMLETRSRLRARGISTCGAGSGLAEAREPAIVEADGVRFAFLGYSSTFPQGYEALSSRPGLAPMRACNVWREPLGTVYTPGMRPLATTVPDLSDLDALTQDIERARKRADLVVASFHWGDHTRPYYLSDHETRTARHCIDHGADMVVGHHHHALRGMEWYRGKPIMYGLGHFVFDLRSEESRIPVEAKLDIQLYLRQIDYTVGAREGWPLLPLPDDARMTLLAWATVEEGGFRDIGFLPCRLTPDGRVHPLRLESAEGQQVIRYLEKCNETQGLNGRVVSEGAPPIAGFATLRVVPGSAS